jgi:hypothetical protein
MRATIKLCVTAAVEAVAAVVVAVAAGVGRPY